MSDHPEEIRRIIDSVEPVTAAEVRSRAEADPDLAGPRPIAHRRRPALVLGGVALAIVLVVIMVATRTRGPSTLDTTQDGTTVPSTVVGPPPTVLAPVGDDPVVTCNESNPHWFQVSAWAGPVTGEGLDLPAAEVLRSTYVINDMAKTNGAFPPFPDVPITSWRLLSADESTVLWGLGELDLDLVGLDTMGPILTYLQAEKIDGVWQYAGGGGGSCNELFVQPPDGASIGYWMLAEPPGPDATALSITVGLLEPCTEPLTAEDLLGPDVAEAPDSVSVRVAIDRPPLADVDRLNCRLEGDRQVEPVSVTVTVPLSSPLGARTLLDANVFPARPVDPRPIRQRDTPGTTEGP